ncbi:UDP-N-acetylglucosamine--LPS N-acetylglucosamine transferase [uncultured Shimia sp.]|uniref:UDP-N-acetylglucosamine--LPS N-acetylglucosamine transferase n=1 Tax=uncultured Shimia sp. TaxID=573152 RepID=UPI0026277259|nr:UDP-N-acetylglucosamine--LPS N-acetylglucosamine transferase [uncultured Shimia sp.]
MGKSTPHVMAVASAGGHWIQLTRLSPAWRDCRVTYVTTNPDLRNMAKDVAAAAGVKQADFHSVADANRSRKFRLLLSLLQIAFVMLRQRPDVVITTGAAPGYFALRLGRLIKCRTVWVDSIANADELSLSGQMAGKHADLWLTQWEHLALPEGPEFHGAVV